jgi:hypothetical protein
MQGAGLGTGLVNAADKIYPKRSALVVINIVWLHSVAAACGAVLAQCERQDQAAERQGLLILWQGTGPIIATYSNIKNNHN